MADGKGCKCAAYDQSECGCDADWTPQELIDARAEIERLRLTDAEREAIHFMFRHAAQAADHDPFPDSADYIPHHKVISAMMERLK